MCVSVGIYSFCFIKSESKTKMKTSMGKPSSQPQRLFLVIFALLLPLICIAMSDSAAKPLDSSSSSSSSAPAVHIIYTEKPQDEEPEAYHIRTLTAVLGRCVIDSLTLFFNQLKNKLFLFWVLINRVIVIDWLIIAVRRLPRRFCCIVTSLLPVASLLSLPLTRLLKSQVSFHFSFSAIAFYLLSLFFFLNSLMWYFRLLFS